MASEVALSLYVIVIIMTLTVTNEVEVKTEADSNDITEHPHDDKPRPHLCTVCDKRFMRNRNTLSVVSCYCILCFESFFNSSFPYSWRIK